MTDLRFNDPPRFRVCTRCRADVLTKHWAEHALVSCPAPYGTWTQTCAVTASTDDRRIGRDGRAA